jgi:hypothetical protein
MSWRVSLHVPPWHDRDVEMVRETPKKILFEEKNYILIIFM